MTSVANDTGGEQRPTLARYLHNRQWGLSDWLSAWTQWVVSGLWRAYRLKTYPHEGQVRVIEQLLKQIKAGLPQAMAVLVLADRGIGFSSDLCKGVAALGWYYLFRVTCQTKIITAQGDVTIAQHV